MREESEEQGDEMRFADCHPSRAGMNPHRSTLLDRPGQRLLASIFRPTYVDRSTMYHYYHRYESSITLAEITTRPVE